VQLEYAVCCLTSALPAVITKVTKVPEVRGDYVICPSSVGAYRSGGQDSWIKIKCAKTDTFRVITLVEKIGASPRRSASLYLGRWEGDQLLYAGMAQTGIKHRMLYKPRERLDPYIRKSSPLTNPIKKPKAKWAEPAFWRKSIQCIHGRTAAACPHLQRDSR